MKNRIHPFRLFLLGSLTILMVWSCTKETMSTIENEMNEEIGPTPSIELLGVSTTEVTQYEDNITFNIQYQDGDGDIGTTNPDDTVIEIIDQRDPEILIFSFHVSPRAPLDSEITIQGTLDVVLNNTILLDQNNESETTTFQIRIKDRAENWSNTVESESITILK